MEIIIQEKLDGISMALNYREGRLISAVTRGNGDVGDDITLNASHFQGVPQYIADPGEVSIRGEVVLPWLAFKAYWEPQGKANPRNTTSGVCKGRSSEKDLNTLLFVAYDYYGPHRTNVETESELLDHLQSLSFYIPIVREVVTDVEAAVKVYEEYDKENGKRSELPYMTDGLVMRINDLKTQDTKFTIKDGCPTYATAIKPTPCAVISRILKVEWTMGLSGRFCPVAQVEPTPFDGTMLRNVSLHNLERVKELYEQGLDIGAKVLIVRSGDVIPYLTRVIEPAPQKDNQND